MADIKTRDTVKGTIRTLDKGRIAASRMKQAYIQTKDKAEHSVEAEERSETEYASDRMESGTKRVTEETVHQTKKAVHKGAENVKDKVEQKIENRVKKKVELQKTLLRNPQRNLSELPTAPDGKVFVLLRNLLQRPLSNQPDPQARQP